MTIKERAKDLYGEDDSEILTWEECAYIQGATDQQQIDVEKLKDILNRLMLDTKDKAEIIKAMEV